MKVAAVVRELRAERTPFCVDLDGTLLRSDMLAEQFAALLGRAPYLAVWSVVVLMFRGRLAFKTFLARYARVDISSLPFRPEILTYLRSLKSRGRTLVLVTGTNERVAQQISEHLGIFDEFYGTTETVNLIGKTKSEFLVSKYGVRGFDYLGNEKRDIAVWRNCRTSAVVASSATLRRLSRDVSFAESFPTDSKVARDFLRAMRGHQWSKNLLLFVSAFLSFRFLEVEIATRAVVAFFSFSFAASAVYLCNDLIDLDGDRKHPTKKKRPFAAGEISLALIFAAVPALFFLSFAAAAWLGPQFLAVIATYFATNALYNTRLKKMLFVDVMALSGFYCLRIFAGGIATSIPVSKWLTVFSLFLFLALALFKRVSELCLTRDQPDGAVKGRGYFAVDLVPIIALASASGFSSLVIFSIYIQSSDVAVLYKSPILLLGLIPILAYWLGKVLLVAHRGQLNSDPVVFALTDRATLVMFVVAGIVVFAARMGWAF